MRDEVSNKASGEGDHGVEPETPSLFAIEVGDRDLILGSLSLSPEERLSVLQDFVDTFWVPAHG
jgi:hypothetical protein